MRHKEFPTLYKKNSNGKVQFWTIYVEDNEQDGVDICTLYGQEGGAIQSTSDTILVGKNLGKKNETTPVTQALAEAKASWKYQIDRVGYVKKREDLDEDLRPGVNPMLAHRYDKYPEKITLPCYIQPKLDGHRCIAVYTEGVVELFSRSRTPITGLPHINEAVKYAVENSRQNIKQIVLDGELYNHAYKSKFEELTGFIRSQEPKEGYEVVQYHVYDLALSEAPYIDRKSILSTLLGTAPDTFPIQLVATYLVETDEEINYKFKRYRQDGYEGAMLRNMESKYVGKRSYDLQKVKEFIDGEFMIIGVEEGRGKMKGHAIFVCHTPEHKEFKAKMKGSMDKLAEIFQNQELYIGKSLTVMYQDLTADGIPRFPVGLRVREDI